MAKKEELLSASAWKKVLFHYSEGLLKREAVKAAGVTNDEYQKYLRSSPGAVEEVRQAKKAWLRRDWPYERIEDMMFEIASGETVSKAAENCMLDKRQQNQFIQLCMNDPEIHDFYQDARKMQCEVMLDKAIDIADNSENGATSQKVRAAELRIKTLQWTMARMNHGRYGDKIKQEIEQNVTVDHGKALQLAHKRVKDAHAKRAASGKAKQNNAEQHANDAAVLAARGAKHSSNGKTH